MDTVRTEMDGLGMALDEVGVLFTAAGHDPYLFFDEDWMLAMAVYLAAVEVHLDSLLALTPPAVLDGMHNLLLMFVDETQQFVDAAVEGIDNLDDAALLRATDWLNEAQATLALSNAAWQVTCE